MSTVHAVMADQHGLITRTQALAAGLSRHRIDRLIARGEWVVADRRVYRHAVAVETWESRLLAACLASGGLASHRCASALWRLDGFRTPPVELVVPRGCWYRRSGHRVHQTTQWDRTSACMISSIPTTGIERTILDLGAVISMVRLERAAESAMRLDLVGWPDLRRCLIRHSRKGRDGCGRLRALLEARHGADPLPLSDWSRLVAQMLGDAGLPAPELEYPIVDPMGSVIAKMDLAWPDRKVALELDSVRWHLNRKSFELDRRKRNRVRLLGWVVHEVTWTMSVDDRRGLVALVRNALRSQIA